LAIIFLWPRYLIQRMAMEKVVYYSGLNFKCPTSLRTAACQRYPEE